MREVIPHFLPDYYEQRELLRKTANYSPDRYFVIKTSKTTNEMYKSENSSQKGNVNGISKFDAVMTEIGIRDFGGDVNSKKIKDNIIQIEPGTIDAIASIGDDGNMGEAEANNREYSGNFDGKGGVKDLSMSAIGDPTLEKNLKTYGIKDFHSHPSGTKAFGNGSIGGWSQPPSKNDINNAPRPGNGTHTVFGMRHERAFIYDKSGVIATFPLRIFK